MENSLECRVAKLEDESRIRHLIDEVSIYERPGVFRSER